MIDDKDLSTTPINSESRLIPKYVTLLFSLDNISTISPHKFLPRKVMHQLDEFFCLKFDNTSIVVF